MSLPDIRLQSAAVALAEELNFTRAAERLRITQPALSKRIVELENRLGFIVFERDQKRVELTPAGQVFVRGCKDSLALLEKAVRIARAAHENVQPVVTIGHSPYVEPALVSALLNIQLPLYPNLRLRMETMFAHELAHSVLSAELDLAIIEEPIENPLLTQVSLLTVPLFALMDADHPATKQRAVSIKDFGKVGWMCFPKRAMASVYDRLQEAARVGGVSPVELHHYVAPHEVTQLITENFGVAFMAKGVAEQLVSLGLAARPFDSKALCITSHLVLRADQSSRLVNEFGRAFLKRINSSHPPDQVQGQLSLGL